MVFLRRSYLFFKVESTLAPGRRGRGQSPGVTAGAAEMSKRFASGSQAGDTGSRPKQASRITSKKRRREFQTESARAKPWRQGRACKALRTQEISQPKRKEAEGRRGHRCGEEAGKVPIINNLESHDKSKHFSESKSKSTKCFTQRRLEIRSQDFSFVLKLSETTPLSAGEHRVRLYPPPWVSVPEHSVIIRDQDFQESATRP